MSDQIADAPVLDTPTLVDPEVTEVTEDPRPVDEPPKSDHEEILPFGGKIDVRLDSGEIVVCEVKRLRAREFLALLRVLTTGFGDGVAKLALDADDPDEMQGQIMGMMLVAIPEAIDEFVDFMVQVVVPVEGDPKRLRKALDNPEIDMLIDVAEAIAIQEKDDLVGLVGKGRAALARVQSLYQKKPGK